MSEYTTDQILDMIEKLGDPAMLDLSQAKLGRRADLTPLDLSRETIQERYKSRGWPKAGKHPPWYFTITQGINLGEANLHGASLWGANLQGASLWGANLQGAVLIEASLQGAVLSGANLQEAFLIEANLQGARLYGANLHEAHLTDAKVQGAVLTWAKLHEVNLEGARSLEGAYFAGARLHLTRLRRKQIGEVGEERDRDYEGASRAYLGLKVNFREVGYYDDARWAYLQERRMERKTLGGLKLVWSWLEELFTGYMERPSWIGYWLGFFIFVFFPPLYWATHTLGPVEDHMSFTGVGTYIVFSMRTAVTLAYGDLTPEGFWQWLAPVEGALGVAFFALLAFSVAKRISRD